jgi:hypothetical protein
MSERIIDLKRLIDDQGGARAVAEAIGVPRTAPYRWGRTRNVTLRTLERVLSAFPHVCIEKYVVRTESTHEHRVHSRGEPQS